jgi:hypothetical protein
MYKTTVNILTKGRKIQWKFYLQLSFKRNIQAYIEFKRNAYTTANCREMYKAKVTFQEI